MKQHKIRTLLAAIIALAMITAACSSGGTDTTDAPDEPEALTPITLQLQWFSQAQFAGYYAALDQGYYEDLGLDVTIAEGGFDIVPATVLGSGAADFAVSWVPRGLTPREEGINMTNIAQIFERSATLQVSFKETGITSVTDLAGKTVGNWGFGNEFELLAGLKSAGLDPATDVTLVQQQFDMLALISGEIDAAQAMIYNEYAQVLETVNPATGALFTADDLNIIDWNDEGVAMLQDAIWADQDRLDSEDDYRDNAVKFVEASMRGWIYCRDNLESCVDIVLGAGPTLGESHQKWQMNEINALIWPSRSGVGVLNADQWDQTVAIAVSEGILAAVPTDGAFETSIAEEALANLVADGVDVNGDGWTRIEVTLNEGGE